MPVDYSSDLAGYAGFVVGAVRLQSAEKGAVAREQVFFPWNKPAQINDQLAQEIGRREGTHFVVSVKFNACAQAAEKHRRAALLFLRDDCTDGLRVDDVAVVEKRGLREIFLAISLDQARRLSVCLENIEFSARKANPGLKSPVG